MKKVGELWREKKNTVTKEETVTENIKGGAVTKEDKVAIKDVINKSKDVARNNKDWLLTTLYNDGKRAFVDLFVKLIEDLIITMTKDPKRREKRLYYLRRYGPSIAEGLYVAITVAVILSVTTAATSKGGAGKKKIKIKGGQQNFPYTALKDLPYNDVVDDYYRENNEFKQLYE